MKYILSILLALPFFVKAQVPTLNPDTTYGAKALKAGTLVVDNNVFFPSYAGVDTTFFARFDSYGKLTLKKIPVSVFIDTQYLRRDINTNINSILQRVQYSDTSAMLIPYLRSNIAAATYQPIGSYATTAQNNLKVNISDTNAMLLAYRNAIQQLGDSLRNNAGILEMRKSGVFVPQFALNNSTLYRIYNVSSTSSYTDITDGLTRRTYYGNIYGETNYGSVNNNIGTPVPVAYLNVSASANNVIGVMRDAFGTSSNPFIGGSTVTNVKNYSVFEIEGKKIADSSATYAGAGNLKMAKALYISSLLQARQNTDTLIGMDVNPNFDPNGKTGVIVIGMKVKGDIKNNATIATGGYTVATLPTGIIGQMAYVTDATAPTYLGTLTGGGTVKCPVFFNGTIWISH